MNKITIAGTDYVNMLSHDIKIMSNGTLYTIGARIGSIPRLQSEYTTLEEPIETYNQHVTKILNLPDQQENTILIVSLFVLSGYEEIYGNVRDDLRSPGKKVFGKGGKTLYALGLHKVLSNLT